MLGVGICAFFVLPWSEQRLAALVSFGAIAAAGLATRGFAARIALVSGLLMVLGFVIASRRAELVAAPRLASPAIVQLVGTIEAVEIRTGTGQIRLRLAPFDPDLPPHIRISVPASQYSDTMAARLQPGARISMTARLAPPSPPSYPGGYDFARSAWFDQQGAAGTPLGPVSILVDAAPPRGFEARLASVRARLTAHLKASIPGAAGTVSAALVTGEQGAIPGPVVGAMRDSGLAHLLSISGLHIAIVVAGTLWSVQKLLLLWPALALRIPVKTLAAVMAALAGIGYTLLAGGDVPTVRACIATLIVLLGVAIGREALSLRMVAAAALAILLVRPEALLGPSFQLSFAAVTGLIALYNSKLGQWLNKSSVYDGWTVRVIRAFLAILVTGIVAESMLSATALYHFNRTGLYGVFANIVAIPLTSFVIMPLQVLALALDTVGLAAPAYWLLDKSITLLIALAMEIARWPGAVARLPTMSNLAYGLIIGGGIWLCLWRSVIRFAAVLPVAVGALLALSAQPADILVSGDGRHLAIMTKDGSLSQLRARKGSYISDNWDNATAADSGGRIADIPESRCSIDLCSVDVANNGATKRILVTRSRRQLARPALEPACSAADIVISDRVLPGWCQPAWLKLDRRKLVETEAVAIWLSPARIRTVAGQIGDHPWQPIRNREAMGRAP
ncbi:MAG: ComEC/Rec2 family competence protein [Polymorphobacter sp.]